MSKLPPIDLKEILSRPDGPPGLDERTLFAHNIRAASRLELVNDLYDALVKLEAIREALRAYRKPTKSEPEAFRDLTRAIEE